MRTGVKYLFDTATGRALAAIEGLKSMAYSKPKEPPLTRQLRRQQERLARKGRKL